MTDVAQRVRVSGTVLPEEGLRERKKRETREHISHVATQMFLDQGFDVVRVSDVAAAAGVSEKTVYNYFDTKEQLLLDREPAMAERIRAALGPDAPPGSPLDAMLRLLQEDLDDVYTHWAEDDDPDDFRILRRFTALIEQTPSLKAAQRDMMDRLAQVAATALAERAGVDPLSPEPQVAADALLSLWRIQFTTMQRQADTAANAAEAKVVVEDAMRRAARLIDTGLWSFTIAVQGIHTRDQLKAAATASNEARRLVMEQLRSARTSWREAVREHHHR